MTTAHSFPPIVDGFAHTMILGSMPGVASLQADQYYAHPRNTFWPIMGALFGAGPAMPYANRTETLLRHGVAVWDVLKRCTRHGSLDSSIDDTSVVPNDFPGFLLAHPHIDRIFFNGAKAENCFSQHVAPRLQQGCPALARLPSTSPAHASMTFEQKLQAWQAVALK